MLKRQTAFVLFSFTVLAVTACAYGRDFVRPPTESLILGKTTYKEIILKLGKSFGEGERIFNGQLGKKVSYTYSGAGTPAVEGATPGKHLFFFFVDDVLVGHHYSSSLRVDQTDFDESKVMEIKKSETTREAVIELLGPPHGLFMYPVVDNPGHKRLVYSYHERRRAGFSWAGPSWKTSYKSFAVTVDSNDIVTDVKFAAGSWE